MDNSQKEVLYQIPIPSDTDGVFESADKIREVLMKYSCAIREVKTKLEVLSDELSIVNQRNPIEFITTRVKSPRSIFKKLIRKKFETSLESIEKNLDDVAGVRVICSFVDDIYAVADMLTEQDDVTLIAVKDYIKNPKPNGYRSLHLIISIPVFFSNRKEDLRVEVQIRTIAMDFWASLEHDLKYKKEIRNVEAIQTELRECADTIAETDLRMMALRDRIEILHEE